MGIRWPGPALIFRWRQWYQLDILAEAISVKCTEHSYQHSAPDLALMLCTCLQPRWVNRKKLLWRHLKYITLCDDKGVFNILIFFSETTSRWRLILCHYIPNCWTGIICLTRIDTPPAAFSAELQKS